MISSKILVDQLVEMGHQVHVESMEDHDIAVPAPFHFRRHISIKRYARRLRAIIDRFEPDVIISQGEIYPWVIDEARRSDVPCVVFIRDHHFACPVALHNDCPGSCLKCFDLPMMLEAPLIHYHQNRKYLSLARADLVVTNSLFMQSVLFDTTRTAAKVVYPPVDDSHIPPDWNPEYVLLMGNGEWKGIDRVLSLAMARPDYKFVVCGWQHPSKVLRMSLIPNVEYRPWADRPSAFSGARVVLTPSTWPEPFGRVPVEAGRVGIPTISSRKGGLPEAVGPGGILIDDGRDGEWLESLHMMMEDDSTWRHYSQLSKIHSGKFNSDMAARMLLHHIEGVVN